MRQEPSLRTSAQAFFRLGGQHAQFLGVLGVFAGGIYLLGSRIQHWSEEARNIRTELEKVIAIRHAELRQAWAEIIQIASCCFLQYSYTEKLKKCQSKAVVTKYTLCRRLP